MIFTITPNPALDLGGVVDDLVANEKNYVHAETRLPGGNGVNAARIISRLKVAVTASGFVGGSTGKEIESLLDGEGVKHAFVPIERSTRINITVSNRHTHQQTRLSFRGPEISHSEFKALLAKLSQIPNQSLVIIGGSLPPLFTASHLSQLLSALNHRGIESIVDVPGHTLKSLISSKPFLIKPNLTEFHELTGSRPIRIRDVVKRASPLLKKVPLVCVSSVEGGALLITRWGVWYGKAPHLQVRTTVGAGDSMVGAMAVVLWENKIFSRETSRLQLFLESSGERLLRLALASACATLIERGTRLGSPKNIQKFYSKVLIKQIYGDFYSRKRASDSLGKFNASLLQT